ncbi:MAG: hypothetical protein AAFV77_04450 [Planctomycetota bacterium]
MAEVVETTDSSVTICFDRDELLGLSNVINHALHGGFVIDELDCLAITGIEWEDLDGLWSTILQPLGLEKGIN